jgi:photosystem II stability/assembly factor-like uncharacterized protein
VTIVRRLVPGLVFAFLTATLLLAEPPGGGNDPRLWAELRWRMIGPFRGGRTVGAAGVAREPGVFYIGVNNGGVWKTDDYGRTWAPLFDAEPTQSIGALAVAPSDPNVIYVGSGEGLQRPDLSVGDGVYKSTDGGRTWKNTGLTEGRQIGAVLVDPRDGNRVFVAVLGHPYGPNPERGIFRTTDGGATWKKVLYRDENTGGIDLAFDPRDPSTVYAVLWAARQGPWEYENAYRGPGSGLFRSKDGGETWQPLGRGLPGAAEKLGRIGIGIAPGDGKRIYALVEAATGRGLYRSDDAGETWARVNDEDRVTGRGDDFACVRVDPRNRDVLWVANTSTYRSTDGGKTFTAIKGAPGGDDYHTIWMNPENPDIVLLASDQGATISVNGGRTWSSWYNQPTAQMFHVTADDRFPYRVYGGQQESGSAGVATRGDDGQITFRDWHPVGVEEYGYAAPDPLHPGIVYGGKVTRYDERTGEIRQVGPAALRTGKYRFDRTAPILFSPADPHVLYFAAQVLFRTSDGGEHWDVISPDLTRQDPGVPGSLGIFAAEARAERRGVVYAIGPSPRDSSTIWAGTDDGLIHVTRDGGKTWKNVTPPELTPWSKVTQIDASHFDPETAYVSVSRFRLDDLKPYVYRTHDGGKTWTKIVAGLPENASVNVVREDPVRRGLLFCGTERAVWVSFDDGASWQSLQQNLPATSVRDLVVHGEDLAVATHGRGFWILDGIAPLRQATASIASEAAHLFAPAPAYRVRRSRNDDTPLPPEEPAGRNPPDGALLDYVLGPSHHGPVTLEVLDSSGRVVRRYSSEEPEPAVDPHSMVVPAFWARPPRNLPASPGAHRFVWDLREPPPDALEREYPISAIPGDTPASPQGAMVPPGAYTVRLTAAGRSWTQPLAVKMDPRVTVGPADVAAEYAAARRITEAMRTDFQTLGEVRRTLAAARDRARAVKPGPAADALAALISAASDLEGGPGGRRGRRASSPATLARVNGQLSELLTAVDQADAAPTAAQLQAVADLEASLARAAARWKEIRARELAAADAELSRAGESPIRP